MKKVGNRGLSNSQISIICDIISCWKGKLTWKTLVAKIEMDHQLKISRQSLCTYYAIKKEFDLKKLQIKNGEENYIHLHRQAPKSVMDLEQVIESQNKKIERLERALRKQTEQLQRFILNARDHPNIDLSTLNNPREFD